MYGQTLPHLLKSLKILVALGQEEVGIGHIVSTSFLILPTDVIVSIQTSHVLHHLFAVLVLAGGNLSCVIVPSDNKRSNDITQSGSGSNLIDSTLLHIAVGGPIGHP